MNKQGTENLDFQEDMFPKSDANELFEFDQDDLDDKDDTFDPEDYDGVVLDKDPLLVAAEEAKENEEEEEEQTGLNFEDKGEEDKGGDFDIEALNKKMDTNFENEAEFKSFLDGKKEEEEKETNEKILEDAELTLDFYEPLLKLEDEALMTKQFEMIAINNKQNLNDEDVKIDIEEQVQDLIDSRTLSLQAAKLRGEIENLKVNPAIEAKRGVVSQREAAAAVLEKTEKEELQNVFAKISKQQSFFGVNLDNKKIVDTYKDVQSGKFIDELKADKEALAELALFRIYKEEIFKSSTGMKYEDGIKAMLDEFKNNKDSKPIPGTSSRRSSPASSASTQDGLIADVLYNAPVKREE